MANDRNGLDVDKYDYLMRDSMYCNVPISVCINRIFSFVKARGPCNRDLPSCWSSPMHLCCCPQRSGQTHATGVSGRRCESLLTCKEALQLVRGATHGPVRPWRSAWLQ